METAVRLLLVGQRDLFRNRDDKASKKGMNIVRIESLLRTLMLSAFSFGVDGARCFFEGLAKAGSDEGTLFRP